MGDPVREQTAHRGNPGACLGVTGFLASLTARYLPMHAEQWAYGIATVCLLISIPLLIFGNLVLRRPSNTAPKGDESFAKESAGRFPAPSFAPRGASIRMRRERAKSYTPGYAAFAGPGFCLFGIMLICQREWINGALIFSTGAVWLANEYQLSIGDLRRHRPLAAVSMAFSGVALAFFARQAMSPHERTALVAGAIVALLFGATEYVEVKRDRSPGAIAG
jgi:hypothetical protein